MVLQQGSVNFSFGACKDPRKGVDLLETEVRQYQLTTKKKIDDDTRNGDFLRSLANGNELNKKKLVLNAYQVESFSEKKCGIHDFLGMWLTPEHRK